MPNIKCESSWDSGTVAAGRYFVGLTTVDLALRLCGLNCSTGLHVGLDGNPLWALDDGIGRILRARLSVTGLREAARRKTGSLRYHSGRVRLLAEANGPPRRSSIDTAAACIEPGCGVAKYREPSNLDIPCEERRYLSHCSSTSSKADTGTHQPKAPSS